MTSTHKRILKQANQAISKGDFESFLSHCTENMVWNFLGDRSIHGKKAVHVWMMENYKTPPKFDVNQMIAEGEFVVATGDITLQGADGQATTYSYCDVWRFENGYLAELNAYVIEKNLN